MRKHFLKIVSAAATVSIALTLGSSSAVAENNNEKTTESTEFTVINDNGDTFVATEAMLAEHREYTMAFGEAYNRALKEELSKVDMSEFEEKLLNGEENLEDPNHAARDRAYARAEEECRAKGLVSVLGQPNIAAISSNEMGFRKEITVGKMETADYNLNLKQFYFEAKYNKGYMKAISDYAGNYKHISITMTYENGEISHKTTRGNSLELNCEAPEKTNCGKLVKTQYAFYIYNGTGSGSDLLNYAIITFNLQQ